MLEIASVHTVNGQKFRTLRKEDENGIPIIEISEVLTPHCGWKVHDCNPTCTKACDIKCRLCQDFFEEVGIDY